MGSENSSEEEWWIPGQKVSGLSPGRSGGRMFLSRVNLLCWHSCQYPFWEYFSCWVNLLCWLVTLVSVPPPYYRSSTKDPGDSAKSAGGRLQLNTHEPCACGLVWSHTINWYMVVWCARNEMEAVLQGTSQKGAGGRGMGGGCWGGGGYGDRDQGGILPSPPSSHPPAPHFPTPVTLPPFPTLSRAHLWQAFTAATNVHAFCFDQFPVLIQHVMVCIFLLLVQYKWADMAVFMSVGTWLSVMHGRVPGTKNMCVNVTAVCIPVGPWFSVVHVAVLGTSVTVSWLCLIPIGPWLIIIHVAVFGTSVPVPWPCLYLIQCHALWSYWYMKNCSMWWLCLVSVGPWFSVMHVAATGTRMAACFLTWWLCSCLSTLVGKQTDACR